VLYGGIGVDYGKGYVWKWDAGTESATEAEKGRASDAFKRAGFKHGIGRELYSAPFIWISAKNCNIKEGRNGKPVCYDNFYVAAIDYDEDTQDISRLVIKNGDVVVYEWQTGGAAIRPAPDTPKPVKADRDGNFTPVCRDCGKPITIAEHDYSTKNYGIPLCRIHQRDHSKK
jgi:hypothetical protein